MSSVNEKTATFIYREGESRTFGLLTSIKGLRDSKGRRPIKVVLNFSKTEELSPSEAKQLYCNIIPALDPIDNEVIYYEEGAV